MREIRVWSKKERDKGDSNTEKSCHWYTLLFPQEVNISIDWNSGDICEELDLEIRKTWHGGIQRGALYVDWRQPEVSYPYIRNIHRWLMNWNIPVVNFVRLLLSHNENPFQNNSRFCFLYNMLLNTRRTTDLFVSNCLFENNFEMIICSF